MTEDTMPPPRRLTGNWPEPSPIDLDQFHERCVAWAEKLFAAKGDDTLLGYFAFAGIGQTSLMHIPWRREEDKYQVAYSLRKLCAENAEIEAYSFITEAWATRAQGDDYDWDKPVHEQPDREDVLHIFTSTRDHRFKMTRYGVKYYQPKLTLTNKGLEQQPAKPPRLLARDDHTLDKVTKIVGMMFDFFVPYEEMQARISKAMEREGHGKKQT